MNYVCGGESSDVVHMASYAPLFVNNNDRRYAPHNNKHSLFQLLLSLTWK
jgi:hypothetical protein